MKAKYIPVLLWALFILIATNNYNFTALLANDINFNVRLFPNLSDLCKCQLDYVHFRLFNDAQLHSFSEAK